MPDDQPTLTPARAGPTLAQIADRVLNRPLLIHPAKADVILHILEGRLPIESGALADLGPEANRFIGSSRDGKAYKTYAVQNGVAIITIVGSLVNRGAWIGAYSGMVSYEGIAKQLADAADDPKVNSVIIDIDSGGGEATGMFTLASKVREVAAKKPVVAVINDMAASAAYGIASQATQIVVSPTSIVGSIGVVLTHIDRSGEMAAKGVKPTLIYAGRHKVDGHPFGPLSDAVVADLQMEVGKFYDQFVSLVAVGRGEKLTEQDARATEARTYIGQDAIDRGLADRMGTIEDTLAALTHQPPHGATTKGPRQMSGETNPNPAASVTQEAHVAAVTAARAEGVAEGRTAGATEAVTRIGAILRSDAAKGKNALAMTLAFDTDLSLDAAVKALTAAASEAPVAAQTIQQRAQGATEFGGPDAPEPGKQEAVKTSWSKAVADANQMIGAAK